MTQQVLYDAGTGEILQWQDTAAFGYPAPPAGTAVLAVTEAQWAAQATPFYVSSGALVAGVAPPAALSLAQQAEAALAAGLTITSTGTPALNGTYPVDPTAQAKVNGVATYIIVNGKFPGSAGTYSWLDMTGAPHTFPTTAEFQAFATAVADYVSDLELIMLTNTGTLPPSTSAIA